MKKLAALALVLGLASIGANLYAVVETMPNYRGSEARIAEGKRIGDAIELRLNESYRSTLKNLAYAAAATGAVALVAGAAAGAKGKSKLGWAGAVIGVAGLVWQFTWAV